MAVTLPKEKVLRLSKDIAQQSYTIKIDRRLYVEYGRDGGGGEGGGEEQVSARPPPYEIEELYLR